MKQLIKGACILVIITLLAACGVGGGGGGTTTPPATTPQPTVSYTSAILKLSIQGTLPAGTALSGLGLTVTLPDGVIVETNADGTVKSGMLAPSGVLSPSTASCIQTYMPASGATPGKLDIIVISTQQNGFGTGEFATVTCKLTKQVDVTAASIVLSDFKPADLNLTPISGLTPVVSVALQ